MKSVRLILLAILASLCATAQITPAENDTVNYRMVGFSFPPNEQASYYRLEVATGINNNHVYFKKNIINKAVTDKTQVLETMPSFGQSYTWQITYLNHKKKSIGHSPLYHFTTGKINYADTAFFRLNVIKNEYKKDDLWILSDGNKCMYGLDGNPLWFMPVIPDILPPDASVRDLKITKDNTITFLVNIGGYEIDYNGNILWHTPDSLQTSEDGSVFFHHEFTKLDNGHYMVAAQENIMVEVPPHIDTTPLLKNNTITRINNKYYKKISSGTIFEYDSSSNLIWELRLAQFFKPADYFVTQLASGNYVSETHLNSFYLDEKNNLLFVSLRNVNQVLKISYPEGKLLARYDGAVEDEKGNGLSFLGQHSVRSDNKGSITLFNNNMQKKKGGITNLMRFSGISTLIRFKNDTLANGRDTLVKQWEFPCNIDSLALPFAAAGGSLYTLQDDNLIVSMGSTGRIFIVSPDKNVLWNALGQMRRDEEDWRNFAQYRASTIEGKERLEQLIFHSKK